MDIFTALQDSTGGVPWVDMHTTGGPARIPIRGLPSLQGTLQQQRAMAFKPEYDSFRTKLLFEPRGHRDMYGVILRPETELTSTCEAHIGVLYMHTKGYSLMCGHATLAVARFLIDTHDSILFPNRERLIFDERSLTTELCLHAPCGLLRITVPTLPGGRVSDPNRDVSFLSVPSFASTVDLDVLIPSPQIWPQLCGRTSVSVDISYGGSFYVVVSAQELGFSNGLRNIDLSALRKIAVTLMETISTTPNLSRHTCHPSNGDLLLINGVAVTDDTMGLVPPGFAGCETGVIFTSNTIDRSPCGSGTAARVALAFHRKKRSLQDKWAYNSLLSFENGGLGAFVGIPEYEVDILGCNGANQKAVVVRTEGRAFYTGLSTYVVENMDKISVRGFDLMKLTGGS